jgi:hypothetical protein
LIPLSVRLEAHLFDALQAVARSAGKDVQVLRKALEEIVRTEDVFEAERELIFSDIGSWFDIEAMALSPEFWVKQAALRAYLERCVEQSVAALAPYLPASPSGPARSLTVHLIPGFTKCYGPTEGVQLFALRAEAQVEEALLFLIHVYYHEISSLFYTETSRRAVDESPTTEMFKHWLLLLIQNEGLANYIVLKPLLQLRDDGCEFSYFTYANLVHREELTARAMTLCREILSHINDDDYSQILRGHVTDFLKNPRLPIINLVGIHLAEAIAATFSERELFSVANREPQEFFRMYSETGDRLCPSLFGPQWESAKLFGLMRRSAFGSG